MKVFDLTCLRSATEAQTWLEDVNYPVGFSAHNIAINEETGFAYLVGGNNGLAAPDQPQWPAHGRHQQPDAARLRRLPRDW